MCWVILFKCPAVDSGDFLDPSRLNVFGTSTRRRKKGSFHSPIVMGVHHPRSCRYVSSPQLFQWMITQPGWWFGT